MTQSITISFVGTTDLKVLLEKWAKEEDRTISATLRRILEAEAKRREVEKVKRSN
jgi:hypothetical protein